MPATPLTRAAVRCRVALIDDHRSIVEMLEQFIELVPGFKVVGHAGEADGAMELVRREQPDVIILDLMLPSGSGLTLLGELRKLCSHARVLIFSGNLQAFSIQRALSSGAHGLVGKISGLEEFRQALMAVSAGRVFFSRSASEEIRDMVHLQPGRGLPTAELSERERTVLQAIADGLSSKEISCRLGLSIHTVVNHRTRLMHKTGLRGVAQLSRYAAQIGLVTDPVKLATPPDPAGGRSRPPGPKVAIPRPL